MAPRGLGATMCERCMRAAVLLGLVAYSAALDFGPEYAGLYLLSGTGTYSLQLKAQDGVYADDSLGLMVVAVATLDENGLEEAEDAAQPAWEEFEEGHIPPVQAASGDTISPDATVVYQVILDPTTDPSSTSVDIVVSAAGPHAFFMQHHPDEFDASVTSPSGGAVLPSLEEIPGAASASASQSATATTTQWLNALGASIIISLTSLVGLGAFLFSGTVDRVHLSTAYLFAAGALVTVSLVHLVPEAFAMIGSGYDGDWHKLGWRGGSALAGGVFLGLLVHTVLQHPHGEVEVDAAPVSGKLDGEDGGGGGGAASVPLAEEAPAPPTTVKEGGCLDGASAVVPTQCPAQGDSGVVAAAQEQGQEAEDGTLGSTPCPLVAPVVAGAAAKEKKGSLFAVGRVSPLCWNIIVGDLVHNTVDGILIGGAFLSCSTGTGWAITAATLAHEVPQEVADFAALVKGGLRPAQALAFNFMSALSCVLGVVVMLLLSSFITQAFVGFLLMFGAGQLLFLALAELLPACMPDRSSAGARAWGILWFLLGAVLLGLPLLRDEHCEAAFGGEDVHDHGR